MEWTRGAVGQILSRLRDGFLRCSQQILNVGALNGEIAKLVEKHQCGITVEPGDAKGSADAISRLAGEDVLRATLGANARKALEGDYDLHHSLQKWRNLLDTVIA